MKHLLSSQCVQTTRLHVEYTNRKDSSCSQRSSHSKVKRPGPVEGYSCRSYRTITLKKACIIASFSMSFLLRKWYYFVMSNHLTVSRTLETRTTFSESWVAVIVAPAAAVTRLPLFRDLSPEARALIALPKALGSRVLNFSIRV